MRKRMPIFFLLMLLAGALMGLASTIWAQDTEAESKAYRLLIHDEGSFLGVHLDEVTAETAQRLNLPEERGALITRITADSPAAKAGLQKDDVIVRWNGTRVESATQLRRHIHETPAGRTVRLGVVRAGRETDVTVTLGKRADHPKAFAFEVSKEAMESAREALDRARDAMKGGFMVWSHRGRMGVTLQNLTPQLAEYFGLKDRSGALITSVREDSPASRAGFKAGDIILAIDGETVEDPDDAMRLIAKKEEGPVEVRIMRDRREMSLTVTLEKREKSSFHFAPEIDLQVGPSTFHAFPHEFVVPRIEVHPAPPLLWQAPEIRAPLAVPRQRLRVTSGVI